MLGGLILMVITVAQAVPVDHCGNDLHAYMDCMVNDVILSNETASLIDGSCLEQAACGTKTNRGLLLRKDPLISHVLTSEFAKSVFSKLDGVTHDSLGCLKREIKFLALDAADACLGDVDLDNLINFVEKYTENATGRLDTSLLGKSYKDILLNLISKVGSTILRVIRCPNKGKFIKCVKAKIQSVRSHSCSLARTCDRMVRPHCDYKVAAFRNSIAQCKPNLKEFQKEILPRTLKSVEDNCDIKPRAVVVSLSMLLDDMQSRVQNYCADEENDPSVLCMMKDGFLTNVLKHEFTCYFTALGGIDIGQLVPSCSVEENDWLNTLLDDTYAKFKTTS